MSKFMRFTLIALTTILLAGCSTEQVEEQRDHEQTTTATINVFTPTVFTPIKDEQKVGDISRSNIDGIHTVTITHPNFTESVSYSDEHESLIFTIYNRSANNDPFSGWREALQSALILPRTEDLYFTVKQKNIAAAEVSIKYTDFKDGVDVVNWMSGLALDTLGEIHLNSAPATMLLYQYGNRVYNSGTTDCDYLLGECYNICEYYYNTQYFNNTEIGREAKDYGLYILPICVEVNYPYVTDALGSVISITYTSKLDGSTVSIPYMITDGDKDLSTFNLMSDYDTGSSLYAWILFRPIGVGDYTMHYEELGEGCTITIN